MQQQLHLLHGGGSRGSLRDHSATTTESVQWILAQAERYEEVCFTSGEPTTNRPLHQWVKLAHDAGAQWVSMMTNGRALAHEGFAKRLIARYKRYGLALHTSTVVTKRNLPHLHDIDRFLRARGVDQVVFNVMQANGRANTYFKQLFPRYSEIAAQAEQFLREAGRHERPVQAFFVDIPLCATTALPDHNCGYVEDHVHFEPEGSSKLVAPELLPDRRGGQAGERVQIRRADLDDDQRRKRPECAECRYDAVCEGVWGNYLRRYGWDELQPVPRAPEPAAVAAP